MKASVRLFLLFISFILFAACRVNTEVVSTSSDQDVIDSTPGYFSVETTSDGQGQSIETVTIAPGEVLEFYAIKRDMNGRYLANHTVSWSKTGSVGTLSIVGDGRRAQFSSAAEGSVSIQVLYKGKVETTIDISIVQPNEAINISGLVVSNPNISGFDVKIDFTGDAEENSVVTLYYCNESDSPGCDPLLGDTMVLTRSGSEYVGSLNSLSAPYDEGELINIAVDATDPQGVTGGPLIHPSTERLADLRVSNLVIGDVTKDLIETSVTVTEMELVPDGAVSIYYCNESDSPGCDPMLGNSVPMTKNGTIYELNLGPFPVGYDDGELVNLEVAGTDAEGVYHSGTLTAQRRITDIEFDDFSFNVIEATEIYINMPRNNPDNNGNSSLIAYYCNDTTNPGCDPVIDGAGTATTMTYTYSNRYTAEITGISESPGDLMKVAVVVSDPDGAYIDGVGGSPQTLINTYNIPQATPVFRSVGPGQTSYLDDGVASVKTLQIVGDTATFGSAMANQIGIGDAIFYDSTGDTNFDKVAFIHGRTSDQVYTLADVDGGSPVAITARQDWRLYRSYTAAADAETGLENSGITADVDIPTSIKDFDSWSGGKNIGVSGGGADQEWNIVLYAGIQADTSAVTVAGWTKTYGNRIRFFTPTDTSQVGVSQRHAGVWDPTKYRLVVTDATAFRTNKMSTIDIEGLQIEVAGTSGSLGIYCDNNNRGYVGHNIIRNTNSGNDSEGIRQYSYNTGAPRDWNWTLYYNNIIYDFSTTNSYGFKVNWQDGHAHGARFYNNTLFNNYNGVVSNMYRSGLFRNNIIMGSGNLAYDTDTDTGSVARWENNLTDDNSYANLTTWGTSGNVVESDPSNVFIDHTMHDFRLKVGSPTIGTGQDLSGGDSPFTDDILGLIRGTWDMGAHRD